MKLRQTEIAQTLRQAGYRLTQPRLAVLQVLQGSGGSLSPEEIHQQGKAIYASLGLVTVYRTLEILNELGLVRRVHSKRRCHSFASAGEERHHLLCQRCRCVVEFPCEGLDGLIESVRQRTGYAITSHLLELSGLCPACQVAQGAGEAG